MPGRIRPAGLEFDTCALEHSIFVQNCYMRPQRGHVDIALKLVDGVD